MFSENIILFIVIKGGTDKIMWILSSFKYTVGCQTRSYLFLFLQRDQKHGEGPTRTKTVNKFWMTIWKLLSQLFTNLKKDDEKEQRRKKVEGDEKLPLEIWEWEIIEALDRSGSKYTLLFSGIIKIFRTFFKKLWNNTAILLIILFLDFRTY